MKDFDYRGLKCPIPVIKAFKEIKSNLKKKVIISNVMIKTAPKDFRDLCDNTGLKLSKIIKEDSYYLIVIERP